MKTPFEEACEILNFYGSCANYQPFRQEGEDLLCVIQENGQKARDFLNKLPADRQVP